MEVLYLRGSMAFVHIGLGRAATAEGVAAAIAGDNEIGVQGDRQISMHPDLLRTKKNDVQMCSR
jgi:hypothetical protein